MNALPNVALTLGVMLIAIILAGCANTSAMPESVADDDLGWSSITTPTRAQPSPTSPATATPVPVPSAPAPPVAVPSVTLWEPVLSNDLADQIQPVDVDARTLPALEDRPSPITIELPSIGVTSAPIVSVGVEPNGDLEIPPADEVGWYRFGPHPGAEGAAVLAAHIAFNGKDGVFRSLDELTPGDRFTIRFEDAPSQAFIVESLEQYPKDELPDELFAKRGKPRLVLITCGGSFNRQISSYDDNVVAIAVPA